MSLLRNWYSLIMYVVPSLSFTAMGTASTLLLSYLSRTACGHHTQDLQHTLIFCPVYSSIRRDIFCSFLSLFDLWSRLWGNGALPICWVSMEFLHAPSSRRVWVAHHHQYYSDSNFSKDISSQQLLKYTNSLCNLILIIQLLSSLPENHENSSLP